MQKSIMTDNANNKTLTGYPSTDKANFSCLGQQIQHMLDHKHNRSKPYPIPENIPDKSKKALCDLQVNHDHGLCVELFLRNEAGAEKTALLYRGRQISYREMFASVFAYARSFAAMGIKKGDEIPVLISNLPEYVYVFLGLNIIGATMNTVGDWFHPDYLHEIFADSKSKYLFVSDNCFEAAKKPAEEAKNIEKIIMFSVTDSLPLNESGKAYNPYQDIDEGYNEFTNKVEHWKKCTNKEIVNLCDFLRYGEHYGDGVVADTTLDDTAAITYTSGTTSPGYPKACIHSNRNYLAISRFKQSDVSGMPPMKNIIGLALLPSYTQTVLTTAYCDTLFLGCTVALEPFYNEDFFAYAIAVNKANYVVNTPGFFLQLAKKLENDPEWINVDMPYLLLSCVVGESVSSGEERYLNRIARKHRFGSEKLPLSALSAPICTGGGSTENGGVFTTLFSAWQGLKPKYRLYGERPQLKALPLAEVDVLDEKGGSCPVGKPGRLVINSPCNQIGYVNDEFNEGMHITDSGGKQWYSGGAYAVKYRSGDIRIVGRPNTNIVTSDGVSTPLFIVEDIVNSDFKNIMSAVTVRVETAGKTKYVCHIEKQPDAKMSDGEIIRCCGVRLSKAVHPEISDNLYIKIRDSFPLAPSGKRDLAYLTAEGIDDSCVKLS